MSQKDDSGRHDVFDKVTMTTVPCELVEETLRVLPAFEPRQGSHLL